ncbi:hypothetical protein [Streptomyces sp. NPDC056982]|uniref:hypothetical protein n=1 Tax=Streptomyces sp. NPDC056982 TaxID=3345986 RepID=UPI00362D2D6D
MARDIRARLNAAADQLHKDGHVNHAYAVQAVLAPRGWTLLQGSKDEGTSSGVGRNLAMSVTDSLRSALKEASEQTDTTLGAVATAGLDRYVKGKWIPPKPVRSRRGTNAVKGSLNVRIDEQVLDAAVTRAAADSAELGYKLTVAWIALSWLVEEFDLQDALN